MAYQFDGTDDYMTAALNLSGSNILSISFWLYQNAYDTGDDLAMEFTSEAGANSGGFYIDPNSFSGAQFDVATNPGTFGGRRSMAQASAAAWHHYLVVLDHTQTDYAKIFAIYVDGSSATLTDEEVPVGTANFANDTLYVMCRNAASLFNAGRMAELALYLGNALDGTDATELTAGVLADDLTSAISPTHYWRMLSDTTATVGGVNLTNSGAIVVDHPPVYLGGTIVPQIVAHLRQQGIS